MWSRAGICAQSRDDNRNRHIYFSDVPRISFRDRGPAHASGSLASKRDRRCRQWRDQLEYRDSDRAIRIYMCGSSVERTPAPAAFDLVLQPAAFTVARREIP